MNLLVTAKIFYGVSADHSGLGLRTWDMSIKAFKRRAAWLGLSTIRSTMLLKTVLYH